MAYQINRRCERGTINSETKSLNREAWLDGLRALPMLFVIIGHQVKGYPNFHLFISPIKLPLFFSISGYLIFGKTDEAKSFFSGLVRRLMIPWFLAIFAEIIVQIPFRGFGFVPGEIYSYFVDTELWYLPCLFFAEMMFFMTLRCCKTLYVIVIVAMAESILGCYLAFFSIADAMRINTACIVQAFLLIGYILRYYEKHFFSMGWGYIARMILTYVLLGIISMNLWPGKNIDVNHNYYICYPYSLVMIYVGCIAAFLIAKRMKHIPGFLSFIGQNTLLYYMSHNFVISGVRRLYKIIGVNMSLVPSVIITTFITCIVCGMFAMTINRFFPILAGNRQKREKA